MKDRKSDSRYERQSGYTDSRRVGGSRPGESHRGYESRQHSQHAARRDYGDRYAIQRRKRAGCMVSIGLFIVILAALYIIIFKTSLFDKDNNTQTDNENAALEATQQVASTPTPTLKPESTEVPTPVPEPMSSMGYVNTRDQDGTVRLRERPDQSSDIICKLHNRETLYLLSKESNYYKIRYYGEIGYVHQDYVVEHLPLDNLLCDVVTNEIEYSKLVEVTEIIPSLIVEMPYATESNHVNKQMYPFELVLLQESTALKLKKAQEMFLEDGYSLVIWDAYRPHSVTKQTFEIIQDPVLAADPEIGSKHNRGAAIDVTLFNLNTGEYVDMPTEVREMDRALAKRSSSNMTYEQRQNMKYMEEVFAEAGFSPYSEEWWHYNDMEGADYPVLNIQFEAWENK